MLEQKSIAFKLNLLIISISSIILVSTLALNYYSARESLTEEIKYEANMTGKTTAINIENIFYSSEVLTATIAEMIEEKSYTKESIVNIVHAVVSAHPQIYGCTVTFAPYEFDKNLKYFSPYIHKSEDGLKVIEDTDQSVDYTRLIWYSETAKNQKPNWTEPYLDPDAGNIMTISYSIPFFADSKEHKIFKGIVSIDISLEWLSDIIKNIGVKGDRTFILSRSGKIIHCPFSNFLGKYTIFDWAEKINYPELAILGKAMIAGKTGFLYTYSKNANQFGWLYYAPIKKYGWSMAIFFPDEGLNTSLEKLNLGILSIGLFGLAILIIAITLITKKITSPLKELASSAQLIGNGKLENPIRLSKAKDEVGILTKSFETMRVSLIAYIDDLKKTTAAKEATETELKLAASLQLSILPVVNKKFLSTLFDLYVRLVPAKEVSGDFYDFFFLNDNTLAILIADVSGKGFSAAFYMSMAKFAIKNSVISMRGSSPGDILEMANSLISEDNDSCMFLTCYLLFYNIETGHIIYANAGHNEMLLARRNGKTDKIGFSGNIPLGVRANQKYNTCQLSLEKEDILLLFTDGISEASDKNDCQFGENKILEHLSANYKESIRYMGDSLIENVIDFESDQRFDDITLLILKRL